MNAIFVFIALMAILCAIRTPVKNLVADPELTQADAIYLWFSTLRHGKQQLLHNLISVLNAEYEQEDRYLSTAELQARVISLSPSWQFDPTSAKVVSEMLRALTALALVQRAGKRHQGYTYALVSNCGYHNYVMAVHPEYEPSARALILEVGGPRAIAELDTPRLSPEANAIIVFCFDCGQHINLRMRGVMETMGISARIYCPECHGAIIRPVHDEAFGVTIERYLYEEE